MIKKKFKMKRIFFLAGFFITIFMQPISAQDSLTTNQLSQLLTHYYGIKDALVAGNATIAAIKSTEFMKTANGISKVITKENISELNKDAVAISETKDIKKQREHFSGLSNNMSKLAKSIKMTTEPVYLAYCPMKKVNWLSSDKEIKNPYYGNAMLTCGNIVETIN